MTADAEPFDVAWREETLGGTLHRPSNPVGGTVLMMQGSGPSGRDAEGYFTPIRTAFLERGIATYAFDKPGCGESTGDWRRHGLFDRADQIMTVLDALGERPDLDRGRIGIWGQSQGGWLAQIVAADRPELAFSIANSGPSIGVVEQDRYGCEQTMRASGHDDADITRALDHIGALHAAAANGATFEEVDVTVLDPARGQPWAAYMDATDDFDWSLMVTFVAEAYEPIPTLQRIRCPFLAVYGGCDVLVPAWRGARETGDALTGCPDATVVVFPRGDHRIQIDGPLDFAPGYLDLIADWAEARVRRAG